MKRRKQLGWPPSLHYQTIRVGVGLFTLRTCLATNLKLALFTAEPPPFDQSGVGCAPASDYARGGKR